MRLEMHQTLIVFYAQLKDVNSIKNIQDKREAHFEFIFLQKILWCLHRNWWSWNQIYKAKISTLELVTTRRVVEQTG